MERIKRYCFLAPVILIVSSSILVAVTMKAAAFFQFSGDESSEQYLGLLIVFLLMQNTGCVFLPVHWR